MASQADKSPNAGLKAKKFGMAETRVLRFWDSMQTKGIKKVVNQDLYLKELKELRLKYPGEVQKFVFGEIVSKEYLEEKEAIENKFLNKLYKHIVADNGNYIYSDEDLREINQIKNKR